MNYSIIIYIIGVKNCDIATDVILAYNSTYLPECSRAFIEYLDTLYPNIP